MIKIAFVGRKHSGKSTAACFAEAALMNKGFDPRAESFAAPIKRMREAFLESTGIAYDGINDKETPMTALPGRPSIRSIEQTIGTEWGRWLIHPDIWLAHMELRLTATRADAVVIDDVRFRNELEWCRTHGFSVVWIQRPTSDRDSHPSEQELERMVPENDEPVIHNDGTIEMLEDRVNHLIDLLLDPIEPRDTPDPDLSISGP
ncbi:MAG: hypothetical protein ACOCTG_00290 [Bacteroidota bacterium]